jgi:hypothetical protein
MKSNAMSYRFNHAVEAEIEALIAEHTPAFRKHFKPFRREMLRTAVIEMVIERYMGYTIPRSIALWQMSDRLPPKQQFTTKHQDYSLALKQRGPTLAEKVKNGTNTTAEVLGTDEFAFVDGKYDEQWNYAESCGDLIRFNIA